jgi:hypothetical protein
MVAATVASIDGGRKIRRRRLRRHHHRSAPGVFVDNDTQ